MSRQNTNNKPKQSNKNEILDKSVRHLFNGFNSLNGFLVNGFIGFWFKILTVLCFFCGFNGLVVGWLVALTVFGS